MVRIVDIHLEFIVLMVLSIFIDIIIEIAAQEVVDTFIIMSP